MRTLKTSLMATIFLSCGAYAGASAKEGYVVPQSLDSIGSMFQDTNDEDEAIDANTVASCEAKLEILKVRMAGLNALLEHTDVDFLGSDSKHSSFDEHTYGKALRKIELRVLAFEAERQQLKSALVQYREVLDSHIESGQHEKQLEAVFGDISAVLGQVEASFADLP